MKLLELVIKVVKKIVNWLIREHVPIDGMFGLMQGCDITHAISVVRQLQGKYMEKKEKLCFRNLAGFLGMLYGRRCSG